jgi:hypothetical protein
MCTGRSQPSALMDWVALMMWIVVLILVDWIAPMKIVGREEGQIQRGV